MTSAPSTVALPLGDSVLEHVGWNIQHGRNLEPALDLLEQRAEAGGRRPALLTLQELHPEQGSQVAERLSLVHVAAPPNARPGSGNALFYDPSLFSPDPSWTQYPSGIRHNPAVALLRMIHPGTQETSFRPMFAVSCHASYSDPVLREHQARAFSELAKHEHLLFAQGDWNSWPVWGCPTSLDGVTDRAYAQNRSVLTGDGAFRPDDNADRILACNGLVDVGRHAATELGQEGSDKETTGHGQAKAAQAVPARDLPPGGAGPIDRTYTSAELLPALIDAKILSGHEVDTLSDHLPQVTRWSMAKLWLVMNRQIVPIRH
jgi:endonuclease/exonuclease/phosphatase family metal-dependent hydrolase